MLHFLSESDIFSVSLKAAKNVKLVFLLFANTCQDRCEAISEMDAFCNYLKSRLL